MPSLPSLVCQNGDGSCAEPLFVLAVRAPCWLISLTTSSAALFMLTTPSLSLTSPMSIVSLLTKSMSFHSGRCCNLLSSCEVRSNDSALIPLRHRKAGITLVPSGVSKKVDGSLKLAPAVPSLSFMRALMNESISLLADFLLKKCSPSATLCSTVESLVLGTVLYPSLRLSTVPASEYSVCT